MKKWHLTYQIIQCCLYGAVLNGFEGHWKGRALEIETFLGPEMATSEVTKAPNPPPPPTHTLNYCTLWLFRPSDPTHRTFGARNGAPYGIGGQPHDPAYCARSNTDPPHCQRMLDPPYYRRQGGSMRDGQEDGSDFGFLAPTFIWWPICVFLWTLFWTLNILDANVSSSHFFIRSFIT